MNPLILRATIFMMLVFSLGACEKNEDSKSGTTKSTEKVSEVKTEEGKSEVVTADYQSKKYLFNVKGMTCGACEGTVSAALKKIAGVTSCNVSAKKGTAEVVYDSDKTNIEDLAAAINSTGFKVNSKEK